jgi:hypothetical protein
MPKVIVSDSKGLVQETGEGFVVNNNDSDKPGYIVLTSANGNEWYLSVGNDGGALMVSSVKPTADETAQGGTKALHEVAQGQ